MNRQSAKITFSVLLIIAVISSCSSPRVDLIPTATAFRTKTSTTSTNIIFLSPTPDITNAYFVSPSGDDTNPGTETQPWRTIQKAADTLTAGETVYIRGGVYEESVYISNSGTQEQPIRFLAYPGEIPIIDGSNYELPNAYWGALLGIPGDYIQVTGLEVRYSNWIGVSLAGHHNRASNMNVHHNRETGVLVSGDYGIFENGRVWQNANRNENNPGSSDWASGLSAARHPTNVILYGNSVYNNWGEGLSTFEANGTIIEANIVYDNWAGNIYVSDSVNVVVQRNLVYESDNDINSSGSVGIMLGDETYNPPSSNVTVINNIVFGTLRNFYWWQGRQGGGMDDVLIANNTFVNSTEKAGIQIDNGHHQDVRVYNNIIQQYGPLPVSIILSLDGIIFSNNLWSKTPPSIVIGHGDLIGDPKLKKVGDFTSPEWYCLLADSPARNHAMQIREVVNDFFGKPRSQQPDIGAFEYEDVSQIPIPVP
ncbi:MAG: right-handed parallel beta-helix repeat-containing protein [Anaerolineales bacterium]|nr:right-handed parallel beta-helix repeat-containing protein [Anaerolineales bacterium]